MNRIINNIPSELILHQMELGPLANFLYFVGDQKSKKIAVIDPAWDIEFLCSEIDRHGYSVSSIFLTHGHPDHVNGLEEILKKHDVPVYISKHEAPFYKPNHKNIIEIEDQHILSVGSINFRCILAPGHSPGCQCFLYENTLIAGDVVFIDGVGRCDLPGGDARVMYESLYNIIIKLPDETIVFPGHNYGPQPYATIKEQKQTNPYLTCQSKDEFLIQRMGFAI